MLKKLIFVFVKRKFFPSFVSNKDTTKKKEKKKMKIILDYRFNLN